MRPFASTSDFNKLSSYVSLDFAPMGMMALMPPSSMFSIIAALLERWAHGLRHQ